MAKYKIITRKGCQSCAKLKEWLADKNVDWEEIDYHSDALNAVIEKDESFASRFCDMSACVDTTPIIVVGDNENYIHGEIWDIQSGEIREDKATPSIK